MIEAKPRHDAAQESFRLAHRIAIDGKPAKKRFLDNVFGVRDRSQHPIGDPDQSYTQRIEDGGRVMHGVHLT